MRLIALIVVVLLALGFGVHKQQDNPAVFSCGQVTTGGHQLNDKILTFVEDVGEFAHWIKEHKDDPIDQKGMEKLARKMWREVLWLWFKAFMQSGTGTKLDPQILRLHEKAEQERQQAEDQCAPCPTATPVPPVGGVDPRVMLTVSQSTGTESEQIVRTAVAVANQRQLPDRAKLIIVEAGLVESGLRNLSYGDRDSVGWLQQRPSAGWGTVAQIMDPAYAAGKFYDALVRVDGWQSMSPGRAAQAVQISAFPDRYDEREQDARDWLDRVGESPGEDTLSDGVGVGCSVDPTEPGVDDGSFVTAGFSRFQNPRTVAQAIEFMSKQGSTYNTDWPTGGCLHWVGAAYGYPGTTKINGRHWAIDHWTAAPDQYKHPNSSKAPRGALLFWDTGLGRAGHIAISNGDGKVWSSDQPARGEIGLVPFSAFSGYGKFMGWLDPYFYGQTKVADSRAVQA